MGQYEWSSPKDPAATSILTWLQSFVPVFLVTNLLHLNSEQNLLMIYFHQAWKILAVLVLRNLLELQCLTCQITEKWHNAGSSNICYWHKTDMGYWHHDTADGAGSSICLIILNIDSTMNRDRNAPVNKRNYQ